MICFSFSIFCINCSRFINLSIPEEISNCQENYSFSERCYLKHIGVAVSHLFKRFRKPCYYKVFVTRCSPAFCFNRLSKNFFLRKFSFVKNLKIDINCNQLPIKKGRFQLRISLLHHLRLLQQQS